MRRRRRHAAVRLSAARVIGADLLPVETAASRDGRGRGQAAADRRRRTGRLKAAVADLSLDKQMLQEAVRRKP